MHKTTPKPRRQNSAENCPLIRKYVWYWSTLQSVSAISCNEIDFSQVLEATMRMCGA